MANTSGDSNNMPKDSNGRTELFSRISIEYRKHSKYVVLREIHARQRQHWIITKVFNARLAAFVAAGF